MMVKHKNHKKVINEIITQKLGNYNNLFKQILDSKDYTDELASKCKLNRDDITFCKDFFSYVNNVAKFKELDLLIDEVTNESHDLLQPEKEIRRKKDKKSRKRSHSSSSSDSDPESSSDSSSSSESNSSTLFEECSDSESLKSFKRKQKKKKKKKLKKSSAH